MFGGWLHFIEKEYEIAFFSFVIGTLPQFIQLLIKKYFRVDLVCYTETLWTSAAGLQIKEIMVFESGLGPGDQPIQILILFHLNKYYSLSVMPNEWAEALYSYSRTMQDVAVDFVSGNLAGWSFITMGMPLDFVKTKLQLQQDVSLLRLHELKKDQGFFKTFYRGASSLYLFFGIATALEFTTF